jgi:signal transduction histidine kinase
MRQPPEPVRETPQPVRQAQEPLPSISEVVARIERLRISREEHPAAPPVALPPARPMAAPASSPGAGALFRWECDPSGEIAWVEGAPRGAFVGRSIARREGGEGVDEQVERAFALRAPFRDAELLLAGEGAVAGEWKISGVPAFNAGRFAGYRGVAVREPKAERAAPALRAPSDPDSLRELVHELKTPLTAIIGFAEIIESQLLGPANDAYRERAREIAGQARLLLAAIEDLDFAARSASAAAGERTVNLGAVVEGAMARLRESAATRGVTIETSPLSGDLTVAVAPELADRLVMRLCDAVVGQSDAGDHVGMSVDGAGARVRLSMDRPSRLASVSDEELFRPSASPSSAGYWLRLVRNLARMVGADLVTSNREIALSFPRP